MFIINKFFVNKFVFGTRVPICRLLIFFLNKEQKDAALYLKWRGPKYIWILNNLNKNMINSNLIIFFSRVDLRQSRIQQGVIMFKLKL